MLASEMTWEEVRAACLEVENLRDDIDAPMRKCVAAFTLLGAPPLFSCCGFDYAGQPAHKRHQYGSSGFVFNYVPFLDELQWLFIESRNAHLMKWWFERSLRDDRWLTVSLGTNLKTYTPTEWVENTACIHYSEQAVVRLGHLENFLLSLSDRMVDAAVLQDGNAFYQQYFPHWQYPPKREWVITKEALLAGEL